MQQDAIDEVVTRILVSYFEFQKYSRILHLLDGEIS